MTNLHTKRFAELAEQAHHIAQTEKTKHPEHSETQYFPQLRSYQHIEPELILGWSVKVKSLLSKACGPESEHLKAFALAYEPKPPKSPIEKWKLMRAVFDAAKEDFEGGYLTSVRNLVQAEVFSDELEQAKALLNAGYTAPAAVVAGVVLETSLRNLCTAHGIPHGSMDRMNAELAKAGQYNALTQKRVTAIAAIRNSAAHGKNDEYFTPDVKGMIEDVERFMESWLA